MNKLLKKHKFCPKTVVVNPPDHMHYGYLKCTKHNKFLTWAKKGTVFGQMGLDDRSKKEETKNDLYFVKSVVDYEKTGNKMVCFDLINTENYLSYLYNILERDLKKNEVWFEIASNRHIGYFISGLTVYRKPFHGRYEINPGLISFHSRPVVMHTEDKKVAAQMMRRDQAKAETEVIDKTAPEKLGQLIDELLF